MLAPKSELGDTDVELPLLPPYLRLELRELLSFNVPTLLLNS